MLANWQKKIANIGKDWQKKISFLPIFYYNFI